MRSCKNAFCATFCEAKAERERGEESEDCATYLTTIFPRVLGFTSCMSSSITVTGRVGGGGLGGGGGRMQILHMQALHQPDAAKIKKNNLLKHTLATVEC